MNIRNAVWLIFIGIAAPVLPAFASDLKIVATTPDLGSIVKEVVAETGAQLDTLGRPSEDPHFVDAKPSFILKLNRADVLVEGGAELEVGWLPALLDQSRNEKIASGAPGHVSCAKAVDLLEVPVSLDRSRGDEHAAGNPHYLTDPVNAQRVARYISESLCSVDQGSCERYRSNAQRFSDQLDSRLRDWNARLAPFRGRQIVAYHNSWPYFVKRFGLRLDLFLEPKPGIPPTPANLANVISRMKAEKIGVIIVDPYLNRQTAETVARSTNARVLDVAQFPGGIKGTEDGYVALLDYLVNSLADALSKGE
ncbi:MAG: metal ABC transporter substrate-binding protein [Bdellovibrionota bacterium]